ncbi:MAG: hypothetical protein IJH39_11260 [Clostridia bacterium]|nr:hypothetical protein [Clostridia bacterium]
MKHLNQYIKEALVEVNGFCILKPEFLEHEYDFDNMLKNNGWIVVQKVKKVLSIPEAQELYISKKDEKYYEDLCNYMASGESISYMCYKDCKDPIKDMESLKNKVRKSWGKDDMKNAMHSSDSIENVNREYKLILQNISYE